MDGGLLDHVYIKKSFSTDKVSVMVIKHVNFPDHGAMKLQNKCKMLDNMDKNTDYAIL